MDNANGLLVNFFWDTKENKVQSQKEGRPIFEDREFVEIIPVGDTKTRLVKEVTDEHRNRWPEQYDRFKRAEKEQIQGTPLKEWPAIKPSQIKQLEYFNVFSVEQLAELDDLAIQRLGPGTRELRAKAEVYLRKARENAVPEQLATENQQLRDEMEALKENMKQLSDQDGLKEENESLKSQVEALQQQVSDIARSRSEPEGASA